VGGVAFESLVKLLAFHSRSDYVAHILALTTGFGDIFARASQRIELSTLLTFAAGRVAATQAGLPSQPRFHGAVNVSLPRPIPSLRSLENVASATSPRQSGCSRSTFSPSISSSCDSCRGAMLHFPGGAVDADTFVLTLPNRRATRVACVVRMHGGPSAATAW